MVFICLVQGWSDSKSLQGEKISKFNGNEITDIINITLNHHLGQGNYLKTLSLSFQVFERSFPEFCLSLFGLMIKLSIIN